MHELKACLCLITDFMETRAAQVEGLKRALEMYGVTPEDLAEITATATTDPDCREKARIQCEPMRKALDQAVSGAYLQQFPSPAGKPN
jgi:hypothetical protein